MPSSQSRKPSLFLRESRELQLYKGEQKLLDPFSKKKRVYKIARERGRAQRYDRRNTCSKTRPTLWISISYCGAWLKRSRSECLKFKPVRMSCNASADGTEKISLHPFFSPLFNENFPDRFVLKIVLVGTLVLQRCQEIRRKWQRRGRAKCRELSWAKKCPKCGRLSKKRQCSCS